ncbi:ABC transporter permease [Amycolatopsis magusensis]|uniref:ABC-2 type transport system permease protein n=1 Tax=Amycolatopsis magusensis TaxID=882444 RepID=A0ABS4PHS4_9PSEU|nr:ABC transporter permease [Amycolatopsis magusensis]MBP2178981.1 ABC-2 type transport system permease protein [Amycolatopsis magusensis]MDI5978440.1 ABC transporter permease [Amycolatopsis magusensis]
MTTTRSAGGFTAVRLVAQRELNTRLRTKSFVIGTLLILAFLGGYVLLQASLFSGADKSTVGLAGQTASIADTLKQQGKLLDREIETVTVTDLDDARGQVADDELDAVLTGSRADLQVLVKNELDPRLGAILNQIAQNEVLGAELAQAVGDPEQVLAAVQATTVKVTQLEQPDPERGQRLAIGLAMVVLLYMSITTYGSLVAQGVVEEKSSRVVEILLSTVRPWQLLLGKVIGLGLVGLAQLLILAGAALAMTTISGVITLSGVATSTIVWGLVWYLLGFFLYATIFAGAGALVSRQEDMQSTMMPVTMVLLIGFLVGFNVLIQDPDSSLAAWLSLIPLLSPVLMPGRIAAGVVAGWEVALALVLTVAAVALFTWLGGKIYRNAVLRTGSRVKLTEALRG